MLSPPCLRLVPFGLALMACHPAAFRGLPAAHALNVLVEGRHVLEGPQKNLPAGEPAPSESLRVGYSLSRISGRFSGPDISVDLEDLAPTEAPHGNQFAVTIDGVAMPPLVLRPAHRGRYALARGLPGGQAAVHTVRLTKRTEYLVGEVRFFGFVAQGAPVQPPLPSTRRILFVGDSITCGYGNLGHGPHCAFSATNEDATLSYAGQLTRRLGASAEVVAYSGRGVWRNLDGSQQGTLPALLRRTFPNSLQPGGDGAAPLPQAIVVNLGTNDAFASGALDQAALQQSFVQLLLQLRASAPDAHIFLALGPMLSNSWDARPMALRHVGWAINGAMASRRADHDTRLTLVGFPSQDGRLGYGCDYHPSVATHAQMSQHLADYIEESLGWSQDPAFGRVPQIL